MEALDAVDARTPARCRLPLHRGLGFRVCELQIIAREVEIRAGDSEFGFNLQRHRQLGSRVHAFESRV